jgi:hypothetical protein
MLKEVIIVLGGSSILLGAVAYLIKSILTHFLSKDIEAYKMSLKAEVQKSLIEHDTVFRGLHSKRAETIEELYSKLVEAVSATESFLSIIELGGEPTKEEKYKVAMKKIIDFFQFFDKRRIFLNESLCIQIDDFISKIRNPTIEFSCYLDLPDYGSESSKQKRDVWMESWTKVKENEVPKARKALETEFRKLLGVYNKISNDENIK